MRAASLVVVVGLAACARRRSPLPPITDRNYAIELYDGVALGNSATVAMGGASAANAFGTVGHARQPVGARGAPYDRYRYVELGLPPRLSERARCRRTTTTTASVSSELGARGADARARRALARLGHRGDRLDAERAGRRRDASARRREHTMSATTSRVQLAVAKWVPQLDMSIGVARRRSRVHRQGRLQLPAASCSRSTAAASRPARRGSRRRRTSGSARALTSQIIGGNVTAENCDPMNCDGFILPDQVVSGRRGSSSAARIAGRPSRGTSSSAARSATSASVTVVSDLVVTGQRAERLRPRGVRRARAPALGRAQLGLAARRRRVRVAAGPAARARRQLLGARAIRRASAAACTRTFGIEVRVFEFQSLGPAARADLADRGRRASATGTSASPSASGTDERAAARADGCATRRRSSRRADVAHRRCVRASRRRRRVRDGRAALSHAMLPRAIGRAHLVRRR